MISGGRILSSEDDVVEIAPVRLAALAVLAPRRLAGGRNRFGRVEPPAVWLGGAARWIVGKAAAGPGVAGLGSVRSLERGSDVGTGAIARVDDAEIAQALERRRISGASLRLDEDRFAPLEAEPRQVGEDRVDEFGAAAALIEILDPDEEPAPAFGGGAVAQHRAKGVAEMQPSGRRRSKARDLHCCPP